MLPSQSYLQISLVAGIKRVTEDACTQSIVSTRGYVSSTYPYYPLATTLPQIDSNEIYYAVLDPGYLFFRGWGGPIFCRVKPDSRKDS